MSDERIAELLTPEEIANAKVIAERMGYAFQSVAEMIIQVINAYADTLRQLGLLLPEQRPPSPLIAEHRRRRHL